MSAPYGYSPTPLPPSPLAQVVAMGGSRRRRKRRRRRQTRKSRQHKKTRRRRRSHRRRRCRLYLCRVCATGRARCRSHRR